MPTLFFDYKVRSTARTPSYDGTETSSWADVSKTLSAWSDALGWEDVNTVGDLTQEQRRTAAQHSLLGEVGAETWRELIFFPVVNPNTGNLNRGALQAVIGGRGSQADIPAEALESAQSRAERLLDSEFSEEDERDVEAEEKEVAGVQTTPTQQMQNAAQRGLDMVEDDMGGSGLQGSTVRRARKIARGDALTRDEVMKGSAFWGRNGNYCPLSEASDAQRTSANLWGGCGESGGQGWFPRTADRIRDAESESAANGHASEKAPSGDSIPETDAFVTIEDGMDSKRQANGTPTIDPGYPTRMGGSVKQVDTSTRVVTGYYAAFGNVDADREEFVQGAFEDTIRRRGPMGSGRIKHLWQHDPRKPIGVPQELREDESGLYFETKIVDTRLGTDALKLYEEEVITEHSVGFTRIDQEPQEDGSTLITEVQLWEGSSVTWGANPNTPTTGIKGNAPNMETLAQKAQGMRKVLSRGLSDAVAAQVEIGLKQIEDALRRGEDSKDQEPIDVLGAFRGETKESSEEIVISL